MDIQNEIDKMLRKGQIDEAILRLNEQIQATATPCDRLYYLLGNAYRKRGDFAQALNCYLEAMAINPDSPAVEAHQMLMKYHGEIQRYNRSRPRTLQRLQPVCGGLSAPYISAHGKTSKQKRVSLCRTSPKGFVQRMFILWRGVPGRMHYRI